MSGRQTLWGSLVEAKSNIAAGFAINYVANWFILPHVGCRLTLANNLALGLAYTVISLVRQFALRRYFNSLRWGHR